MNQRQAAWVAEDFEREQGLTETDWLRTLPGACAGHALQLGPGAEAVVCIEDGELRLRWEVLPPRRIALISLPRLRIHYQFVRVDASARQHFMAYFDLYLQRGGG